MNEAAEVLPEIVEGALAPLGAKHVGGQAPPRKYMTVGDRVFTPVLFRSRDSGADTLHAMSQREMVLVHKFLTTMSIKAAAAEIGVDVDTARRYLARKRMRAYIEDHLQERALAAGTTIDYLLAKIRDLIDGKIALSEAQMDGIKTAAKILRPHTPAAVNLTVNQQNNTINKGGGPSPYSRMSKDELMAEMREVVEEAE